MSAKTLQKLTEFAQANGLLLRDAILFYQYEESTNGNLTIGAGENHIGQVGGNTTIVSSNLVMSVAGSYVAGDYMGVSGASSYFDTALRVDLGTGIIKSLTISDKSISANVAMELWLFSDAVITPTDNSPFTITDAESLSVLAVIPILTTGWYSNTANQVYSDSNLSIPIKSNDGKLIHYALVARGTTPSFVSQDLTITLGILQD